MIRIRILRFRQSRKLHHMVGSDSTHPNADVRMRGFAARSTVESALRWITETVRAAGSSSFEEVTPAEATGRILATDIISAVDVPGFQRSMMDGYAVHSESTYGASAYNLLPLQIVGQSLPGRPYTGTITATQTIRIMTGAPMPEGADAVLPVEQTDVKEQMMQAAGEVSAGRHVGQIGEDIRRGDLVLTAGRLLRPQDAGILSAIGIDRIPVVRKPVVRILVTGSELLPAGTMPTGFQIADANGPMLNGLVTRDGGDVRFDGLCPDAPESILQKLQEPADVILVSGGSSVGQEDHVPVLLSEHGELAIHGIAMRPSSPAGMGRIGGAMVFLLPGNPVSCLCAYDFFAGRAIRLLGGRNADWPYQRRQGRLTRKLVSTIGRVDYARVQMQGDEVEPLAISGASVLSSTTRADGFVVIDADSEGFPPGTQVDVFLY